MEEESGIQGWWQTIFTRGIFLRLADQFRKITRYYTREIRETYRSYVLIFSTIRKKFANNRFLLILRNLFNFFFFLLTWIGIVRRHTRNQWNFLRPITSESGGISIRTIDEGRHSPPRLLDKSVCQFGRWQAVTRSWRSSHAVTTHLVANANTKRIPWKSLQIEKELSVHTLDMRVRARPRSLPSSDIGEGSVGYVYRQGRQIRW